MSSRVVTGGVSGGKVDVQSRPAGGEWRLIPPAEIEPAQASILMPTKFGALRDLMREATG